MRAVTGLDGTGKFENDTYSKVFSGFGKIKDIAFKSLKKGCFIIGPAIIGRPFFYKPFLRMVSGYRGKKFQEDYKHTAMAKAIELRNKYLAPTAPGKPAIPFARKDKDGNDSNISDYKGRVVLLDFWGSWCGPCRSTHPHLKELYSRYKDKGFEIIAIANEKAQTLEEQKTVWLFPSSMD